jgi:plasmid stabilization system protein ParE
VHTLHKPYQGGKIAIPHLAEGARIERPRVAGTSFAGELSGAFPSSKGRQTMPRGDKSRYTDKQKRQAQRIEESYESRGVPEEEAAARAWATVNKETGGGNKSGLAVRPRRPDRRPSGRHRPKRPPQPASGTRRRRRSAPFSRNDSLPRRYQGGL